jgi:hypothetical protein
MISISEDTGAREPMAIAVHVHLYIYSPAVLARTFTAQCLRQVNDEVP